MQRPLSVPRLILLLAFAYPATAQSPYSQSPEYRQMLEELHAPAPSPAFMATGQRPAAEAGLRPEVAGDARRLRVTTGAAELAWSKTDGVLHWRNRKTQAAWAFAPPASACAEGQAAAGQSAAPTREGNAWNFASTGPCGTITTTLNVLTASLASLTLTPTGPAAGRPMELHVEGGGPYFGLGERFWQTGLTGTSLDVRPQDRSGEPGHQWEYVAVPLLYNASGLGLYADTAFDVQFRALDTDASFALRLAHGPVTIYLFAGDGPKQVLSAYTALTGRPQMPPLWTFGPWITSLGGRGSVLDVAHRIRAEGMPVSALWVYDQLDEPSNGGWPFWFANYYGPPREFTDTLHGLGYKVLTYVHPYVREQVLPYTTVSPLYERGVREKLLMTGADGLPAGPRFESVRTGNVDFTNPAAVDWWEGMITTTVRDGGFDGWMEDFGEWVRDSDRFAAGTGTTLSELYPLLYHKITLRIAQALNPEVVPFSRSGSPGTQTWSPVLWGADQAPNWTRDYGLPSVVTAGITAGMSGYSTWGPDILSTGGAKDLWMRWVEFGALTPVMRDHVWDKPDRSFNVWTDPETVAHFRRYAQLHCAMLPYFVAYAEEAHRTGVPIMRHTVLEYPNDPHSAKAEYQYLLGREILVAPVVEPAQARKLYLPEGEWINYWSGDSLRGGQDVTLLAPVDQIPMLVRAGSVLPSLPEEKTAGLTWSDPKLLEGPLVWRMYLSATGATEGRFALPDGTSAHLEQRAEGVSLRGTSKVERDYEIIVRTKQQPKEVRLNGQPFPLYTQGPAGQPAAQWWWNPGGEAHLLFRASDFALDMKDVTITGYTP